MSDIIILESDPSLRAQLSAALTSHNQKGCEVLDPSMAQSEGKPETQTYLWIGQKDEAPPENLSVRERDIFYKPLRLGRLLERIQAHQRARTRQDQRQNLTIGPYQLNDLDNTLQDERSGALIKLTEKEKYILICLAVNKGTIVDRQKLLDQVWGYAEGVETHTLETHIYRLRQKIEQDPAAPILLLTEEKGYRLNGEMPL